MLLFSNIAAKFKLKLPQKKPEMMPTKVKTLICPEVELVFLLSLEKKAVLNKAKKLLLSCTRCLRDQTTIY